MNFHPIEPEVHEFCLDDSCWEISTLFRCLTSMPNAIFLDGAIASQQTSDLNRYSFLAADPIDSLVVNPNDEFDFSQVRQLWKKYKSVRVENIPPFQGGIAGLLSYELNGKLESIPRPRIDEFQVPLVALHVYDVVIAVDHVERKGWIVSQGWPETKFKQRKQLAKHRLDFFRRLIAEPMISIDRKSNAGSTSKTEPRSQMHRLENSFELFSDLSREQFLDMIACAIQYIFDGDIFQTNLSQRLLTPASRSSPDLYLDLRRTNPAPFSAYFDFGDGQVISASPERLVSLQKNIIETRPIKGTRKRTRYPEVDLNLRQELANSEKDRAENVMIVDLMRNDLSRVADPDTVLVHKLCGIEEFQNVLHLVSVIRGQLQNDCDCIDVLQSVFPGGSITGAPKIRAMEIIAELEPTARGPYCGSIGYINFDGTMDFNILIRTITAKNGWWQIPVGGAIVSDSDPQLEYDETWTKAVGMLNTVRNRGARARHPHTQKRFASATK